MESPKQNIHLPTGRQVTCWYKNEYFVTTYFMQKNGKNILAFNATMNAADPRITENEYSYTGTKLALKNGWRGESFQPIQSFIWTEPGHSFKVQGVEWFPFISSTATYFTFTRLP